jgi:3-deoxy-manno-octulosonate cytidylyltransferase (CMP-KDO synthetase)
MQLDKLVVATDDERIFEAVKAFGGNVIMTDPTCNNGTERCLEVLKTLQAQGEKFDIVVNIQVQSRDDERYVAREVYG